MSSVIARLRNERKAARDLMVMQLLSEGLLQREVAKQLGIGESTVGRLAKQRRHDAIAECEVPAWVPASLHDDYRTITAEDGEHAAASYCRRAKREAVMSHGPIEHGVR